jgi:hypothetical protein
MMHGSLREGKVVAEQRLRLTAVAAFAWANAAPIESGRTRLLLG